MRTERGIPRARGFTLLELLVAVALFSVVAVMAYGGLAALVRSEEGLARHSRDWADLQLALQLLETDLSQAVDRPVRDPLGGVQPPMQLADGAVTELTFSRLGSGLLMGAVSQLQRVSYIWDSGRLVRRLWPYPDRVQGSLAQDSLLLEDMADLRIEFVGRGTERYRLWPPAAENAPALPRAVEIVLAHPRIGEIRRLLPVQP